jgi:hypothetical protein
MTLSRLLKSWAMPPAAFPRPPSSAPEKVVAATGAFFLRLLALIDVLHHPQEIRGTARRVVEKGNVGSAPNGFAGLAQVAPFKRDLALPPSSSVCTQFPSIAIASWGWVISAKCFPCNSSQVMPSKRAKAGFTVRTAHPASRARPPRKPVQRLSESAPRKHAVACKVHCAQAPERPAWQTGRSACGLRSEFHPADRPPHREPLITSRWSARERRRRILHLFAESLTPRVAFDAERKPPPFAGLPRPASWIPEGNNAETRRRSSRPTPRVEAPLQIPPIDRSGRGEDVRGRPNARGLGPRTDSTSSAPASAALTSTNSES